MNSPLFSYPSDFSTPKPQFYSINEDFSNEEFSRYLSSLQNDINALGKEVEDLRDENKILKAKIDLTEKEKEKHIFQHAKEKFELEKALLAEKKMKKEAYKELEELKIRYSLLLEKTTKNTHKAALRNDFSPKNPQIKSIKANSTTNIKSKLIKMEKEHNVLKRKIKDLEIGTMIGMNKSSVLKWDEE